MAVRWSDILRQRGVVGLGLALLCGCRETTPNADQMLRDARAALARGEFSEAERLAGSIPDTSSLWPVAASVQAEALGKAGRLSEGIRLYLALGERQRLSGKQPLGDFYAAEALRDAGRLSDSERLYRQFLTDVPDNAATHERLAFLESATGQRWESVPHYFFLVRSGSANVEELILFADLDRPVEQRPWLEECARKAPEDRLVQLGLASDDFWGKDTDKALSSLQAVVTSQPDLISAQALLGELLVQQPDRRLFAWHAELPAVADNHPDIWYVRGLWARKRNQLSMSACCFREAIRLAPTNRRATFQLGQVLRTLQHPNADAVELRSQQLIELTQTIDQVLRSKSNQDEPFRRISLLLLKMGRFWEAGAWGVVARKTFPDATWPRELLAHVAGSLNDKLPLVVDEQNLSLRLDPSDFAPFDMESLAVDQLLSDTDGSIPVGSIHFVEEQGPEFTYWNGADPETPGVRQFEQTGGGVGVLDFDVDGWPDLFFPQGLDWRTGSMVPEVSNRFSDGLFRNRGGEGWGDVSTSAGLHDTGFGQGCAAGDFDNDGFPDLYVANVGRNQLLRNNGDGTFADVTDAAGLTTGDWTVSCALVDVNGDGDPDLYDVNYLTGPGVYEAICNGKACSPGAFASAPDQLLISHGNGRFAVHPPDSPEVDGKGMGIVAFDGSGHGRPSLFIANDQVPNFLLQNRATDSGDRVRFDDEGFPAGVAFNQDGLAMASMGIAADDADGDGRIDFYVSTFKDEGSTLFLQSSPGLFVESANTAGLKGPTFPFVGWGAQFLDADLDGWPDLVGVNGHVDDYRDKGGEYHMRPQFFRNLGGARFEELQGAGVGPYFAQPRLGRGLARLDWNRDGRMDFAVSHIGDRAGLVTNDTAQAGHFLNIRLSARTTARDAIGATVEVVAGDRRWTKQLVAGDGYMAGNERLLQFGLGSAETATRVKVEWPSGATSEVDDVPADRTLELIEDSSRGILRENPECSEVIATVTGYAE